MVRRDFAEDGRQRANSERTAGRHGDAVLARDRRRQTEVTARLTDDVIAVVTPEQRCKVATTQVARQPHTAKSSSWTRCSRTTLGRSSSSKWQATASRTMSRSASRPSASVTIDSPTARAT